MDGIVGAQGGQGQQNQQQHQQGQQAQAPRRKEWRVVSSEGQQGGPRERLFEAAAASSPTPARMSLAQVRPRFPGAAPSRQRNGRVYHSDSDNPAAEKLSQAAKNGEEMHQLGDQSLEETHIDDLQHRLSEVSRQREQLQQMELELQVRFFARNEILRLQATFDEQAKQHSEIVSGLQDQLQQREQQMQQMQQHSEERERQLQMETNEVRKEVWAKDALLREQTNELATLRRERDNAIAEQKADAAQLDAERAEVESLKEQVHDKERRLQELEEQDLFFPNDKQLRDAQLWMARSQELEAYHMNAMHAEIRDRTEQMTQMWVNCQRQVTEVERYYQQIIQKLQQDMEANHFVRNKDVSLDGIRASKVIEPGMPLHHKPPIMHMEGAIPMMLPPDALPTVEHATGLPVLPTPVLGMTSVVPPSGSIPQYGPGSAMQFPQPGQLQPVTPVLVAQRPPVKHQQGTSYQPVQVVQRQPRPVEQKHSQTSSAQLPEEAQPQLKADLEQSNIEEGSQMMFSGLSSQRHHAYMDHQTEQASSEIPPKQEINYTRGFNSVIERSKTSQHVTSSAEQSEMDSRNGEMKNHELVEHNRLHEEKPLEVRESDQANDQVPNVGEHDGQGPPQESNGHLSDLRLLDRDSLLACLIRVIPAEPNAKIRISTTLPNRLAKVLAPLHWHDYRKHYGRLDEFVEAHPQLFVVEGDHVYLREGAHAIVSASTAVAKAVAAAAASVPTGTHHAPTVALTPPAQRSRGSKGLNTETAHLDKRRTGSNHPLGPAKQTDAAGNGQANYGPKAGPAKGEVKRSAGFKENGHGYGNGVLDGYVNFNGATDYFKNMHESRDQDLGARPQTQEGRILEAAQ